MARNEFKTEIPAQVVLIQSPTGESRPHAAFQLGGDLVIAYTPMCDAFAKLVCGDEESDSMLVALWMSEQGAEQLCVRLKKGGKMTSAVVEISMCTQDEVKFEMTPEQVEMMEQLGGNGISLEMRDAAHVKAWMVKNNPIMHNVAMAARPLAAHLGVAGWEKAGGNNSSHEVALRPAKGGAASTPIVVMGNTVGEA